MIINFYGTNLSIVVLPNETVLPHSGIRLLQYLSKTFPFGMGLLPCRMIVIFL
jgi:hypothetical protein